MTHSDLRDLADMQLQGRWVAVDANGGEGLRHLPSGEVLVDYDTELDQLCQRVASTGRKSLTIFLYEGPRGRA